MCANFVKGINSVIVNWTPRKRFTVYKIEDK